MKTVRLINNVVCETIPDYALPVEKWYGTAFASQCMEAPDDVEQHWTYNPETKTWMESESTPDPAPITEDRVSALETENKTLKAQLTMQAQQYAFLEDCILEMGDIVYA